MLSTKHLAVTTVATVAVFALVAPQAHAAAEHSPVLTSSTNTNGNNLQYHENYWDWTSHSPVWGGNTC